MVTNSNAPAGVVVKQIKPGEVRPALKPVLAPPQTTFKYIKFADVRPQLDGAASVRGMLPAVGTGLIYGGSQSYKTFITSHLLVAIASNQQEFAGKRIKKHGAAIYFAAEGGGGIENRFYGIRENMKADPDAPLFIIKDDRPRLGTEQNDKQAIIDFVKAILPEGIPPAVIVFDTFAQCLAGGDENGSGTQTALGNMTDIANELQCLVIAVHHGGKDKEKGPRGHSSLMGNTDFLWRVQREAPLISRITIEKLKDEESDRVVEVQLEKFTLGHNEDGEPVTTLVVKDFHEVTAEAGAVKDNKPRNDTQRFFMQVLERVEAEGNKRVVKADIDGPELPAVPQEAVRDLWLRLTEETQNWNEDTRKREFRRVRKQLIEGGFIRLVENIDGIFLARL